MGLAFFFDIGTLMGYGWLSGPVTGLSFIALGLLYVGNRNKGAVLDERFGHVFLRFMLLAYGITNIGIALITTSVFYEVGSVNSTILVSDVSAMMMIGWGIPLVLFALSEFSAGKDA